MATSIIAHSFVLGHYYQVSPITLLAQNSPFSQIAKKSPSTSVDVILQERVEAPRPIEKAAIIEKKQEIVPTPEKVVTTDKIKDDVIDEVDTATDQTAAQVKNFEETIETSPSPNYPLMARRRGQEGIVHLKIEIEHTGRPVDIKIVQSSGHQILDQAALQAVRRWRFRPLEQSNSTHYFVEKSIEFRLQ